MRRKKCMCTDNLDVAEMRRLEKEEEERALREALGLVEVVEEEEEEDESQDFSSVSFRLSRDDSRASISEALASIKPKLKGKPTYEGRALHYVLKIGERKRTLFFFRSIMGMKILRHEEYIEDIPTNNSSSPMENRWSKTMVGYGAEDSYFALELTYHYGVKFYPKDNDLIAFIVKSDKVLVKAQDNQWPILEDDILEAPGGYMFKILNERQPKSRDPMLSVMLSVSDIQRSKEFWVGIMHMLIGHEDENSLILGYEDKQVRIALTRVYEPIRHSEPYGRIVFSLPYVQLAIINEKFRKAKTNILTPLISLQSEKGTTRVIIVTDPDGHEIGFVDDEGFAQLSKYDPRSVDLVNNFLSRDPSEADVKFPVLLRGPVRSLQTLRKGISGRAVHFKFKVGERKRSIFFFRNILGMKVLRHEEYVETCETSCKQPYENRWSETMLAYGRENRFFAFNLTYNYPVKSYKKGNDFIAVVLKSDEILDRAEEYKWLIVGDDVLEAPGGYAFKIINETAKDPVFKLQLAVSDLELSKKFWTEVLGLRVFDESAKSITLAFDRRQIKIELIAIEEPINRAEAFGRLVFSCPYDHQLIIEENARDAKEAILSPLSNVDADALKLIVLADPDGHEVAFVDEAGFEKIAKNDNKVQNKLNYFFERDCTEIDANFDTWQLEVFNHCVFFCAKLLPRDNKQVLL